MKTNKITEQFDFLGESFVITKYLGSNVIEIGRWEERRFGKSGYERIYFGHIDPLKETLRFFEVTSLSL